MSTGNSGGYSLDQLLEWCTDDRLIDGYDKSDEGVVIIQDGSRREFNLLDAHAFLKGIFTATQRGSGSDDANRA